MKKSQILSYLKDRHSCFASGGEISKILGVSRTAVWKHIQVLRDDGYVIDAVPRCGYRLVEIPDRLYADEIMYDLDTKFIGKKVFYYDSLDSTNREAKVLASAGVSSGSLVVAEEQAGGKGRLGKDWFSPRGMGIWCSVILRPDVNIGQAHLITMLTAVAVASAVEKESGVKPGIKWPNDLLIGDKKICGILTEMSAEMENINYLVVGIGINANIPLNAFPGELKETATSLSAIKNGPVSRLVLLKIFLEEFEYYYSMWLKSGFLPILHEWKKRCITLNRYVKVKTLRESWEGWAEDVDSTGELILRMLDGSTQRFIAGEVSLN